MRLWLKTLIRNSFFQVGAGILVIMILGGLILQLVETGEISQGENPFWWAIVTMTTVGYGDLTPKTFPGRLFAVLVMFAGISLVSLLTATISSIFVARKIREGKGLEQLDIQNHIILCGWNKEGSQILEALEHLMQGKKGDVVLINDLTEDEINHLKNSFRGIRIHYVAGDFTQETILQRANLKKAITVVIIPNEINPQTTNADEKTIFGTLTIKSLEPNVRVVAYLTDRDNLTHIKRANADEVVISDDFGAFILASHVMDPGIPQAVNRLMDSQSKSHFTRVDIPSEFVDKSYDALFEHYRKKHGWVLVGVFSEEDNLGIGAILSSDSSALDAFIERKLKEGGISLQEESKISVTINPGPDYTIKEGERAIIIP
ncbi:MAG: potassium channel family protein [Fidelibacterota bacterium]